jgi:ATP-dependent Clp protease ATP-binding subunit ClpA
MMFERFVKEARQAVKRAEDSARALGSPTIEAEHLLIALANHPAVRDAGLDRQALLDALERETERSLASVGVAASDFELPRPRRREGPLRFGTSAKLAMQRSLRVRAGKRQRELTSTHVLLGVLRAEVGTVPRALEIAGVDRAELAARAEATLS